MTTTAVVTGASRGIGLEVVRQLAGEGFRTYLTARDPDRAAAAARDLRGEGLDVVAGELDVSEPGSVHRFAGRLGAEAAAVDVLVSNAAGTVDWSEVASAADLDAARRVMDVNLFGTWRVVQALLPLVRRSPAGRVVVVSSGAGSHADEDFGLTARGGAAASYGISKAALNALVATLATELAGTGVLVNAVCPGLTATFAGAEQMGARPVGDGARSVVWAALLDADGPSGGLFRDGRPLGW